MFFFIIIIIYALYVGHDALVNIFNFPLKIHLKLSQFLSFLCEKLTLEGVVLRRVPVFVLRRANKAEVCEYGLCLFFPFADRPFLATETRQSLCVSLEKCLVNVEPAPRYWGASLNDVGNSKS